MLVRFIKRKCSVVFRTLFVASMLVGVGPPPGGTSADAQIGGGLDQFQTGGCEQPRYLHRTAKAQAIAEVQHRFANGASLGVKGGGASETVLESSNLNAGFSGDFDSGRNRESETYLNLSLGVAGGWHFKNFGAEVGASVSSYSLDNDDLPVIPSLGIWFGNAKGVYGFLSILERPLLLESPSLMEFGVGRKQPEVDWRIAGQFIHDNADIRPGLVGSAKFALVEKIWLGGELAIIRGEGFPPFNISAMVATNW